MILANAKAAYELESQFKVGKWESGKSRLNPGKMIVLHCFEFVRCASLSHLPHTEGVGASLTKKKDTACGIVHTCARFSGARWRHSNIVNQQGGGAYENLELRSSGDVAVYRVRTR